MESPDALQEPRCEIVLDAEHLPERSTGIVTCEGHDHEVAHRSGLKERPFLDTCILARGDELGLACAIELAYEGTPLLCLAGQDWKEVEASYADMASARDLAKADIAKGNAFTGFLSAIVRPLWGIGAFVLVTHYAISHVPIDQGLQSIIQTVIWFYFGGRVVEKVTPHITAAIGAKP